MSKAKRGTRTQNVPASDEDARKKIRESLDESLLVEAAAGTGKTTELVQRIVAVLAQGKTTIDRLVAVTFTRKASGELKLRLREELDQTRAQSRDPSVVKHLQQAVSRIEEARVGTIHSFCADLLRERPVEANVDPAFLEMDEDGAEGLFQRAFRSWIEQKLSDPTPGLQRALNRCMIQRQWGLSFSPGSHPGCGVEARRLETVPDFLATPILRLSCSNRRSHEPRARAL